MKSSETGHAKTAAAKMRPPLNYPQRLFWKRKVDQVAEAKPNPSQQQQEEEESLPHNTTDSSPKKLLKRRMRSRLNVNERLQAPA